ncbi:MAG: tyrosine-type recombinase/integrase [Acidobacteriia bacterium]|nr:tyrosine-type recombinase/integrase [Terriglobia bacterium]
MNTLREALQQYLSLRRSLGFKLREDGARLLDFVTFMEQRNASYITHELALSWAQAPTALPTEWARRLGFVRVFARHRSATDPRTQIPPNGLLPQPSTRIRPYIYSDAEIQALLNAALKMRPLTPLQPWTYYCLIGLLSVSGMRVGETLNLELQDVDLDAAVLTIRSGKFGKSRLVPLHASTCEALADYIARRDRFAAGRSTSPHLFLSRLGTRLNDRTVHVTFIALSRQAGLRGPSDSKGPRFHDFRHRFALLILLNWYRRGEDAERLLPVLSTYLGHVHLNETYWYLQSWPELMHEAMARLEHRWEEKP